MAAAIVRLLNDPALRDRMGAAGRTRVVEEFSADRMLKDTLAVYRRVALHPHQEREELIS